MEAKITITMTPREYDLVRESLVEAANTARAASGSVSGSPAKVRQDLRARSAQLFDLATKLGK